MIIEGSLEVKLLTIWRDGKSRGGKSEGGEVKKWEDQTKKSEEKMHAREKVAKSRFTAFFPWFGAPEGRKVTSLKRQVRSHLARWEMKNCTPLWREAHFQVKMYKTHQHRTTFGSCDAEKVHAIVHISKSKCTKHTSSGPLLDVQMSKKWTLTNLTHLTNTTSLTNKLAKLLTN